MNANEVQQALHVAFGANRLNPRRGFLRIDPEQAIPILRLLQTEDATTEVKAQPDQLDEQSVAAAANLRRRRPNLNFTEMGIAIGSTLLSTDGPASVVVVGPRRVRLGSEEMSLTAAMSTVLETDYDVGPHGIRPIKKGSSARSTKKPTETSERVGVEVKNSVLKALHGFHRPGRTSL